MATTKGYSSKFFVQVAKFNRCRKKTDAAWTSLSQGMAEGIAPIDWMNTTSGELNGEMRQQSTKGEPVKNIGELFEAAAIAKDGYKAFLLRIVNHVNIPVEYLKIASLKETKRCIEKAHDDYGKRVPGPDVSWLFDVVRAMFLCQTEKEILSIVEALRIFEHSVCLRLRYYLQVAVE